MSGGQLAALMLLGIPAALFAWVRWIGPRLTPLGERPAPPRGVLLFLATFLAVHLLGAVAVLLPGVPPSSFGGLLLVQASVNVAALAGAAFAVRRAGAGLDVLGLRAHRGPPATLVALAAWLAFLPAFGAIVFVNAVALEAVGVEDGVQDVLRMFLEDPAARGSPLVWALSAGVIPFCEELMFRGLLYGSLRRIMPVDAAIALSALAFGMGHGAVALLPTAALGALFAWLYERSGSLAAPTLAHALHNGATMALITLSPEIVP